MTSRARLAILGLVLLLAGCRGQPATHAAAAETVSPLSQWAAVVVGGDATTGGGEPTPIFDNARRDVATALQRVGFSASRMAQLSVNPGDDAGVVETQPQAFIQGAQRVTAQATGCLFYFTSHGNQQGIRFGSSAQLDPASLRRMIDGWCGGRPTVVIVSACYSGVFVPAVAGHNRMVISAARNDRSSFGCGGTDQYPYFDECVLNVLPRSLNFLQMADLLRTCVARREQETNATPPSEPQVLIGEQIRPVLFAAPFRRAG